jgi:hypothetical protein
MSNRLATLTKRFVDAKADVDASKREIREASARKLAQLQASRDPAARLAGLKDPALTPYDRDRLEQTIANLLPRRRFYNIGKTRIIEIKRNVVVHHRRRVCRVDAA